MKIHLEAFTRSDFERFKSWIISEEYLVQFAGPYFTFPVTDEQLDGYLVNQPRHVFTVVSDSNNDVIGHGEINMTDPIPRIARILIADPAYRGKGIGKQIVAALLDKTFAITETDTVELNVYDWNTGAIKCYEAMGFRINPGKVSETIVGGKKWLSLNMVIERKNWIPD